MKRSAGYHGRKPDQRGGHALIQEEWIHCANTMGSTPLFRAMEDACVEWELPLLDFLSPCSVALSHPVVIRVFCPSKSTMVAANFRYRTFGILNETQFVPGQRSSKSAPYGSPWLPFNEPPGLQFSTLGEITKRACSNLEAPTNATKLEHRPMRYRRIRYKGTLD